MQPESATDLKSHLKNLHEDLSRTPEVDAWVDDPVVKGYQSMMNRE